MLLSKGSWGWQIAYHLVHQIVFKRKECYIPPMQIEFPRLARPEDRAGIHILLEQCNLPKEGIFADHCIVWTLLQGGSVIGCSALESYPPYALLRSVAVHPRCHGQGFGASLVSVALQHAIKLKLERVYLLTTTADSYFPWFGFQEISREQVPKLVEQSIEFTTLCPSSAVIMQKSMKGSKS